MKNKVLSASLLKSDKSELMRAHQYWCCPREHQFMAAYRQYSRNATKHMNEPMQYFAIESIFKIIARDLSEQHHTVLCRKCRLIPHYVMLNHFLVLKKLNIAALYVYKV
jgi:hypothetical protein